MSEEVIVLPRDIIYNIFTEAYDNISTNIGIFFGPEEEMEKGMLKEYRAFKEMIINSVDGIHKRILQENLRLKEKAKQEEEEEEKEEMRKSFWEE